MANFICVNWKVDIQSGFWEATLQSIADQNIFFRFRDRCDGSPSAPGIIAHLENQRDFSPESKGYLPSEIRKFVNDPETKMRGYTIRRNGKWITGGDNILFGKVEPDRGGTPDGPYDGD